MKFTYEILADRGAILLRCQGHFTFEDLRQSVERLWSDPRYRAAYGGIVDLTDASLNVSLSDFRALLELLRSSAQTSSGPWVAVTATPLAAACAVLYKRALSGRHPWDVFSTWEAASRHLGIQIPEHWLPPEADPAVN